MARKLTFKNIKIRFVAILIFAICSFIVWNWNSYNKPIPSAYRVFLRPKPAKPETIFQDRDMSIYDFGGRVKSCFNGYGFQTKDCQSVTKNQSREFIYKHWQDKKRAYIILLFDGEGGGEFHVFIEPDKNYNWHIVWRAEFNDFSSNIQNDEMTALKYKFATKEDYPFRIGTKYLSFLDKDGKETGSL